MHEEKSTVAIIYRIVKHIVDCQISFLHLQFSTKILFFFHSRGCILYCFAQLIQNDLDKALLLHNSHRIRPYTFQECPSGKPDLIFQLPEAYGEYVNLHLVVMVFHNRRFL